MSLRSSSPRTIVDFPTALGPSTTSRNPFSLIGPRSTERVRDLCSSRGVFYHSTGGEYRYFRCKIKPMRGGVRTRGRFFPQLAPRDTRRGHDPSALRPLVY